MLGTGFLHMGAGLLVLAGGGLPMKCTVPAPPTVVVTPRTAEIRYDYSLASRDLDVLAGRTGGAARPRDSMTGGLRVDRPQIAHEVKLGTRVETFNDTPTRVCLWYHSVTVTIDLKPEIYVAKENQSGACREAILAHERRHVQVDREVMNVFAADVGRALQQAVDAVGAYGPFPARQKDELAKQLTDRIDQVVQQHYTAMTRTMAARQAQVDTPEEYQRISKVCHMQGQADRLQARKDHWDRVKDGVRR